MHSERHSLTVNTIHGDLLGIPTDAIVNPWNRNFVPRWLLQPGGVSGQLKALTGPRPWAELASSGMLKLGQAVVTDAGELTTARAIIHVAGLNLLWRASAHSIDLSIRNAVVAATNRGFATITMPLIGAGHGHLDADVSRRTIHQTLNELTSAPLPRSLTVLVVELPPQG